MIGWLRSIWEVLTHLHLYVLWAFMTAINGLIAGLGAALNGVMSLLPNLPAVPGPPESGFLGLFAWLFPVGGMAAILGVCITLWIAFLLIRVLLRWVKGV